ncbi:MAG TPA: hypothetical protein VFR70_04715, partial [Flavobacterium sp.]|nr:hypothetical protein [Flavobacterium sp.]
YCLKILIQEVEDMNLLDIYNEENYKNRNLKISKERLETIRQEYFSFRQKAVGQIHFLNESGFMELNEKHEYNANNEIVDEEKKAIGYLKQYALEE